MEKLANLFGKRAALPKPKRSTERGDLYDTILTRLNPARVRDGYRPLTYGRLGYLLEGVKTGDLYALLSKMNDAERRGVAPGAIFWSEIRPNEKL
jgi:hypothetical protein